MVLQKKVNTARFPPNNKTEIVLNQLSIKIIVRTDQKIPAYRPKPWQLVKFVDSVPDRNDLVERVQLDEYDQKCDG
jgi:hypothetical protein